MCGINLLLDRHKRLTSDEAISRMTESTRHRGPDAQAWVREEEAGQQLFISNNRLKILDLSQTGNQPMQCGEKGREGQRFTLSYNGELYNHFELKNELLQKGYSFKSSSDTEVLLYVLAEWGEQAISRLQGMFAFAFYDRKEALLLLARDRQGMKPVYYYQDEQFFMVSSEIRGLLASGLVPKKLNEDQLYHYLQFRYARKPETFYQHIYELLPGQQLSYHLKEGKALFKAFPKPAPALLQADERHSLPDVVEEKLTDALFSQLQADRPVGLFLSGGIDSTLMLALLRNNGSAFLPHCFTIANKAEEARWGTEDYRWANRAARQYDAQHQQLEIEAALLEQFPAFIQEQDQPIGDSAAWLSSLLCQEAGKQGIKVILSGAGADELFGGYNRHRAFYHYLNHYRSIKKLLPLLKPVGRALPSGSIIALRKPLRLWKKLLPQLSASPSQTFLNFLSFQILSQPENQQLEKEAGSFEEGWMKAALQHDLQHYLPSDILALNDKAAMQHSLEMRMPYLDNDLYDYAQNIPAQMRMERRPKWILAEILKKHGGTAYVQRKKEGFGLPFGLWVKEGKTAFLWEWLKEKEHPLLSFLEKEKVENLLKEHKNGREDLSQELFSLATLAHWLSKEFS